MSGHAFEPHVLLGLNPMWVSTIILVVVYAVIIAEKVNFLSRPKSAEGENPELVDRDDEIPF